MGAEGAVGGRAVCWGGVRKIFWLVVKPSASHAMSALSEVVGLTLVTMIVSFIFSGSPGPAEAGVGGFLGATEFPEAADGIAPRASFRQDGRFGSGLFGLGTRRSAQ